MSTSIVKPPRSILTILVLAILWLDAAYKYIYVGFIAPYTSPNADYLKHWQAAKAVLQGETPYYGASDLYLGFNYPMFTAWFFAYLGLFDFEGSRAWWIGGNVVFSLLGAAIIARWYKPDPPIVALDERTLADRARAWTSHNWTSIAFITTANFQPLTSSFMPANVEPFKYVLFAILGAAVLHGWWKTAGLSWAAVTLVKVVPVLLLVPALAGRLFKMTTWYGVFMAIYAVILFVTGFWRVEAFLYYDVLPKISHHYLHISYSTHKAIALWLAPEHLETREAFNRWAFWINAALGSLMAGVCALWWWRRRGPADLLLGFCMVMLALMSPLLEYHHFVWAAPTLFFQIRAWASGRITHLMFFAIVIAWVALTFVRVFNDIGGGWQIPFAWYYMMSPAGFALAAVSAWVAFGARQDIPQKTIHSAEGT